jgi:Ran GTPase-activating protein (RanGAP) involved in mRNA processing and transport
MKHLSMNGTEISDQGFAEIATTLRLQSQLKNLQLYDNNIGRDGCIALGNTLRSWPHSNNLESLNLGCNAIDDEGLQGLVSGLMNCCSLKGLNLSNNQSITAAGLRFLFPLLQSEGHSLEKLDLYRINFGDDGAIALAEGLRGNKSLKDLQFWPSDAGMTSIGWSAFSTLLCDTSTINNTWIGSYSRNESVPEEIQRLLKTNKCQNRQVAAICKILRNHPDLDMEPFFIMKMQLLPAVMSWFEKVEPIEGDLIRLGRIDESEGSCRSRKLSALYKFVRAMPDLAVTGYWEGRVIDIEAKKRRLADEKRMLDDEEAVAWERLSDRPLDDANKRKRMRHE